jgi:hypothetical protein
LAFIKVISAIGKCVDESEVGFAEEKNSLKLIV